LYLSIVEFTYHSLIVLTFDSKRARIFLFPQTSCFTKTRRPTTTTCFPLKPTDPTGRNRPVVTSLSVE